LNTYTPGAPAPKTDDTGKLKKDIRLVRSGASIANSLSKGKYDKAVLSTIVSGIKLAEAQDVHPLTNPLASPLDIARELKALGINALAWKPETLMAAIDRKYNGWTDGQVSDALESFHTSGILKTAVPSLVRQKIYAIRIVATSDTAHTEWHIFEKVGCAFNDRTAHFGEIERLSPDECARTVAIMESIRPDSYTNEVRAYIAACCQQEGMLTTKPSRYLSMADDFLQQMNFETTGSKTAQSFKDRVANKVSQLSQTLTEVDSLPEDIETIQALKLLSADATGDLAIA
jgi:hypothetical protein